MGDPLRGIHQGRRKTDAADGNRTGAGKSTLIKLLIDRQDLDFSEGSRYYSPVTSSSHDRIPTTGDVRE